MSKIYDVIVLGAGPAGLAAGLYAGRSRLSVLIVEKGQDGGQISITERLRIIQDRLWISQNLVRL